MGIPNQIPGGIPSGDTLFSIWENIATALATNDAQALSSAVTSMSSLSPTDKKLLEELVAMLPPPWIPPLLITQIFSNPEEAIGALSRLPNPDPETVAKFFGVIESSIVLSAVVTWLQNESANAQSSRDKAGAAARSDNPIERALRAFIQNASVQLAYAGTKGTKPKTDTGAPTTTKETEHPVAPAVSTTKQASPPLVTPLVTAGVSDTTSLQTAQGTAVPFSVSTAVTAQVVAGTDTNLAATQATTQDNRTSDDTSTIAVSDETVDTETSSALSQSLTQSLQYLRDNPILLASIKTVDPDTLVQAFQIAEAQIMVACLDRMIATQDQIKEAQKIAQRKKEETTPTPMQQLLDNTIQDLKSGTLPLTQPTMMVVQSLLLGAVGFNIVGQATATSQPVEVTKEVKTAPIALADTPPRDDITTSWNQASSALYPNDPANQIGQSKELLAQLGLLAAVYSQMVPYWSIPAAVSFNQLTPPPATDKTLSESAVRAYAVALGTLIATPEFTLLLRNLIVRSVPHPEALTEEQINTYIAALKVTLLMNALIAIRITTLRKTSGQLSSFEFATLIRDRLRELILLGTNKTAVDLESGMILLIQEQLQNIPESFRESFLNALLDTYSEKSNTDALLDPSKQFLRLCDQSLFRSQTAAEGV